MISRQELADYARALGFNLYQAEKDYLQHVFLASLYSVSSTEFVFKGGTALQKAFGLDRFSEDLDFTFNSDADPLELVENAVASSGVFVETALGRTEKKSKSVSAKLKFKGPLFNGGEKSVQTLTLEISLRENVVQPPLVVRIVPQYRDLRPYVALVMAAEEMLAEKIRAILTRNHPRDVYDAWFLLNKGFSPNRSLIDEKLVFYGKKFGSKEFKSAVNEKKQVWTRELGILMKNQPGFEETAGFVLKQLASI